MDQNKLVHDQSEHGEQGSDYAIEVAYRRGFHQASYAALEMIANGMREEDFRKWVHANRKWRSALKPRKGTVDRSFPSWPARIGLHVRHGFVEPDL